MKTALESLTESLEAGTWRQKQKTCPSEPACLPLIEARIEYAELDPAGDALRALLKPGEYLDERGRIQKVR